MQIVVSGELDEHSIAALRGEPVDSYGVGTSVVTGSGVPTAGLVYKLVEVDGQPVAKRSTAKISRGGAKSALRRYKPNGTAIEEVVFQRNQQPELDEHNRVLPVPLLRQGQPIGPLPTLQEGRERVTTALATLPWDGLHLSPASPPSPPSCADRIPDSVGRRAGPYHGFRDHGCEDHCSRRRGAARRRSACPGGSERSGQVLMAEAVDRAIHTGEHLAVQAGTGTGKSLAYLVPSLRHAVQTGARSWCRPRPSRCSGSWSIGTCRA